MRAWGRVYAPDGSYKWQAVTTDANGYNDEVYVTNLAQVFKLNLGESPFFGNFGIPAKPSVVTQVYPDFYVSYTQQQFAPKFASLIITKEVLTDEKGKPTPHYIVNVVTQVGAKITAKVPI